jgi:hypothetical protein
MKNSTTKNGTTGTFNITYHPDILKREEKIWQDIEKELTAVNRDRKINSILEDKEYTELTMEETNAFKEWVKMYEFNEYFHKKFEESIDWSDYISSQLYLENKI